MESVDFWKSNSRKKLGRKSYRRLVKIIEPQQKIIENEIVEKTLIEQVEESCLLCWDLTKKLKIIRL